jgi:hypothetical protein
MWQQEGEGGETWHYATPKVIGYKVLDIVLCDL